MSDHPKSRPSFSTASRWRIGLDVVLRTVLVLAVAGMVNYLGAKFFHRFYLSSQTRMALVLAHAQRAAFADQPRGGDPVLRPAGGFLPGRRGLLNEYCAANKNIAVDTVDYNREPAKADKVKTKYHDYFKTQTNEDLDHF